MTEHAPIPVDTVEPPLEPAVRHESTVGSWARTLGGPVVWIIHFAVVYLVAEASCAADRSATIGFVGPGVLVGTIVAATVVAVGVCVAVAVVARRAGRDPMMERVGVALAVGGGVGVLVTGAVVLVVGPC